MNKQKILYEFDVQCRCGGFVHMVLYEYDTEASGICLSCKNETKIDLTLLRGKKWIKEWIK